jgi:hypothetical protein
MKIDTKMIMAKVALCMTLCVAVRVPLQAKQRCCPVVRLGKVPALQKIQQLQKLGKQSKAESTAVKTDTEISVTQNGSAVVAKNYVDIDLSEDIKHNNDLARVLDSAIQKHAHGNWALVRKLDLTFNVPINCLTRGVFDKLTSLQVLNLMANNLSFLPNNIFDALICLQELDLSTNELPLLPHGIFKHLGNLSKLDLRNNGFSLAEQTRIKQEVEKIAPNAQVLF